MLRDHPESQGPNPGSRSDSDLGVEPVSISASPSRPTIESRLIHTGEALHRDFSALIAAVAPADPGPQALARRLGVDKVLASRLLKAVRAGDPFSVIHRIPGPEPLRRVIKGGAKIGVDPKMLESARTAVDELEALIRDEVGDRAALDTIVSAWVPEARREFELRRKQTLFRAGAELRGSRAEMMLATVLLTPNPDGETIDIAWIHGLLGLRRLRPGAAVTIASRRFAQGEGARRPTSLDGTPIEDFADMRLPEYSSRPLPAISTHRSGEVVRYRLDGDGYGPGSDVSIVLAEVDRAELRRFVDSPGRRAFFFAEISIPVHMLCFDLFVHRDLYPGQHPELLIHDTAFGGVVNLNDPTREGDRLNLMASIDPLGSGPDAGRLVEIPRYPDLVRRVSACLGHGAETLRGFRTRIEYPIYGTQVSQAFRAIQRSAPA